MANSEIVTEMRLLELAVWDTWADKVYPNEGFLMAIELLRLRRQLKAVADALAEDETDATKGAGHGE